MPHFIPYGIQGKRWSQNSNTQTDCISHPKNVDQKGNCFQASCFHFQPSWQYIVPHSTACFFLATRLLKATEPIHSTTKASPTPPPSIDCTVSGWVTSYVRGSAAALHKLQLSLFSGTCLKKIVAILTQGSFRDASLKSGQSRVSPCAWQLTSFRSQRGLLECT